MEPNQHHKEDAAFYALDLLDPKEKAAFRKAMRRSPSLAVEERHVQDLIAAVALTSPPQAAPDLLDTIHHQLENGDSSPALARMRPLWYHSGWAVAACLAVSFVWLTYLSQGLRRELTTLRETILQKHTATSPSEESMNPSVLPLTRSEREAIDRVLRILQPGASGQRMIPVAMLKQLRDDLERYTRLHESRFEPIPGLARLVVTEMRDPSDENSEGSARIFDAQDIATVMAAAVDQAKEGGGGIPVVLEGGDVRWNGQVTITNGLLDLASFNFDDDVVILQKDFPESSWQDVPGLDQLGDGLFYHRDSDYLYQRAADGSYVGTRPPRDFQPDNPNPMVDPPPSPAAEQSAVRAPRATSYFNEVTGNGSIYVRDMPPLEEGYDYHLWLRDAPTDQLISVGPLPQMEDGSELIDFPHGLLGTSPSGYLLTRENTPNPLSPNQSEIILVWP